MIKLNLTSNEFIAILNELAKTIAMQPVSNEVLHSKADIVRQYGIYDFARLMDGLKNNELAESSEWFQAIQYLYHNDELQFVSDINNNTQVLTQNKVTIEQSSEEHIKSTDDTRIKKELMYILTPFGEKADRFDNYTFLLPPLISLIGFSFFFYYLVWWKAILYAIGLFFLLLFIIAPLQATIRETTLRPALEAFLKSFPPTHPDYYVAIEMLPELTHSSFEYHLIGIKLYHELKFFDDERLKRKIKYPTNDHFSVARKIHNILIDFGHARDDILIYQRFFGVITSIVIVFWLYFFYDLTWWKILVYGVVFSILFLMFLIVPIGLLCQQEFPLKRARKSFLLLFPYNHQHYDMAIQILKEIDTPNCINSELLNSISKYKKYDLQEELIKYNATEKRVYEKIKALIAPAERMRLFFFYINEAILLLWLVFGIWYFFVFSDFLWWQAILYAIFLYFLAQISMSLGSIIMHFLYKKKLFNLENSFFNSFPQNNPDHYIAIGILTRMKTSADEKIKKRFLASYRRLSSVYSALSVDTSSSLLASIFDNKFAFEDMSFFEHQRDWKNAQQSLEYSINLLKNLINRGFPRRKTTHNLALAQFNLGLCFLQQWELSSAISEFEKAQEQYKTLITQWQEELRFKLVETQSFIGICLGYIGDLLAERKALEKSIEEYNTLINQENTAESWRGLAKVRAKLGICLFKLDDSEAQTILEEAQNELQDLVNKEYTHLHEDLATTHKHLGLCLQQSNSPAAQSTLEKSIDEFQQLIDEGQTKFRPQLLSAKMALGDYYASCDEFASALEIYDETGIIEYQALIAEGHDELNKELNAVYISLGKCLQALGELAEADNRYEEADNRYEEAKKWYKKADNQYEKALDGLYELDRKGQIFSDEIRQVIAIIQWYTSPKRPDGQDFSEAFETALIGLDWLDQVLTQVSDTTKSDLIENNLELYRLSADFALQFKQPEQAYLILERSKSRVLVEQMLRERAEPGSHVDENLRTQYRELREQLRLLVNQLDTSTPTGMAGDSTTRFFTPTTRSIEHRPEQTEQLLQDRQAVEQELDKVRRAITEQDAAFGEAIQPRTLSLAEVKSLIPAESLVIAFEQRPEFLSLYAITAQGIQTPLQIDLSLQDVNERVEAFKTEITKKMAKKRKELTAISQWLNTHLKQSITELTAQFEPKQIILIPHIAWHLLPIHLVSVEDEPLSVRYAVRYLPSLQILRLISDRPSANQGKGCIIANPWSDALEKLIGKEHELKSGEQEGYQVYALRAQQDHLLAREQATSTAVRQALNAAQHSHFSCHGHFDADLTKAGLTLADCKDLAAIEMFTSIRLDNPRLVVMSACETAQIKPTLADEYMGLSSSFLFAGAHNVLATLWRVDDNASRLLIEAFYQGLNEGLSPVNALQQAQHQLRNLSIEAIKARSPDETITRTYEEPYYWAGFVLIGDGE
jgi:CHAT domain-containing protein